MTAVCTPYHAIALTMADSSNRPKVQEPAREADEGRLVVVTAERDWGILRLIQEKEVIRNG